MIISGPTLPFLMSNETQSSESRQDARCALHSVRGGTDMGSQEGKQSIIQGSRWHLMFIQVDRYYFLLDKIFSGFVVEQRPPQPRQLSAPGSVSNTISGELSPDQVPHCIYILNLYISTLSTYESRQDYDYSLDPPPRQSRPPSRGGGGSLRGQQPPPATERPETTTPVAILKQINE